MHFWGFIKVKTRTKYLNSVQALEVYQSVLFWIEIKIEHFGNMHPLETNRQVLMWLCGIPTDKSTSKWKRYAYIAFTSIVMMVHLSSMLTGAAFIYIYKSIDMGETLYSLIHTLGSTSMLYLAIATVLLSRDSAEIFEGLKKIYNESEWTFSFGMR